MRKIILFVAFLLLFGAGCDSVAKKVKTEKRIISLSPNITEILYALEAQDELVAVTDYCQFPKQVKQKQKIGGLFNPDLEKITALRPDLILATEAFKGQLKKFRDDRFNIVLLPEKTTYDIYVAIDSIGTLVGKEKKAQNLITALKDSMRVYQNKRVNFNPEAILVLGKEEGSSRNIGISGPGAFINEIWEWCGGKNSFPDLPSSYGQVSREEVLVRNPDIIIEFKYNKNNSIEELEKSKNDWKDLKISAVGKNHIYHIVGPEYIIPGPRMYLLAKKYQQIIHHFAGSFR